MVLENLSKETLLELADLSHAQSISVFIPTHRLGKEVNEGQDMIAFKNHVQQIRLDLEAQELRSNDINDLLQPLEELIDDTQFWRHQQEGLAVFRNPDYFAIFHSPRPLGAHHWLDSRFHVRPLLSFAHRSPAYYLLQINKDDIALYKADDYAITPIDTTGTMPSGIEAVTKYYEFEEQLQGRTAGGGSAIMHTNSNLDNKEKDHLLADYFRIVDKTMIDIIGTQNLPLVLASVAYYQPIYREINNYPHLYKDGLTGNFDNVQPEEMHRMAQEMIGDDFEKDKQRRIEMYQNSSGGDLVSSDVRQLLEAGVTGRIDVLFVQKDAEVWGHFDENTLKATIHKEQRADDESLIDEIALLTLRNGGDVYVMDEINLLENQDSVKATALFRF